MPAKEKLNTPAMQAHKSAQATYAKAKEAVENNKTAATEKAFKTAQEALKAATVTLNTERFSRVGNARVNKAVAAINFMGQTFNPRTYTFTEAQGRAAIKYMRDAVAGAEAMLNKALQPSTGAGGAKKGPGITL